jgi:hypothetical protein
MNSSGCSGVMHDRGGKTVCVGKDDRRVSTIQRSPESNVEKSHRVRLHIVWSNVELLSLPTRPSRIEQYTNRPASYVKLAKCNMHLASGIAAPG